MKLKRLTALLLAAAMAFSTAVTALPAYAEGEGGAASSQSAPDADSTPGGPVDDGEPNSGPSGDPVNGNTPGEPNGNTPGDPNSDPANGTEPGAPDSDANGGPSGTPAGGSTPDNTNNDPNSDPAGDPNSDPAGDPTGDPGTQQGEECTCTALCVDGNVDDACTVCSSSAQNCAFQELEVNLSFDDSATYLQVGSETGLKINATVASKSVESVTIKIALSEEESGLISLSGSGNVSYDAANRMLSVTLTPDENGKAGINSKITIKPGSDVDFATLEITRDDIQIVTDPEGALTDDQISVGVPSKPLTFVKILPDNGYGSGVAFETTVAPLTVTYVDSEGKPAAIQQDPPEYKLYFQVEGMDKPRCVQDQVELPFGLENEDLPTVTPTAGESTWTGTVEDASKLPSQVLVKTGGGGYKAVPVTWTLVPSYETYYDDATIVRIPPEGETYPEDIPAGLKPGNWYYIAAPEPYPEDTVAVESYLDALPHTLYWADNLGADGSRPEATPDAAASLYELQFAFDGSSDYQTLTQADLEALGLDAMPAPTVTDNGASWTLTWKNSLPQTLTYTDSTGTSQEEQTRTVSWRVAPKNELADYTLVEVTDENKGNYTSVTQTGPYYVLNSTMTFTVHLQRGGDKTIGDGRQEAFFEQFYLDAAYGEKHQRGQLDYLEELGLITLTPEEGAADNPDVIEITVTGLWRYNLDSSRITYTIQEGTVDNTDGSVTADGDGRLDGVGGVPQGDWLAISYDNSAVPNYGDAVDKVYDGGTINLTLTGETSYEATKNWLDEATQGRPDAVVELWRYRAGESYTTAAPVRGGDGSVLTFPLSKESEGENTCTITFGTDNDPLPKYDAEGYPYLYVAREYLTGPNAPNYEQVLGAVDPKTGAVTDTLPDGVTRESGDTYLYPGGTLSNRLRGTVPVAVTKDWKAASFQSEFEGVMVRLRLQSRPKTEGGQQEAWADTKTTHDMAGFYAENLTQTYTGNFDQYDAQGRELEYRWVEEAVYQGGDVNEEGKYVGGQEVESTENDDGTRTFTLTQSGRTVTYRSKVEEIAADEATGDPACTKITNSIANTIDYAVQKEFKNPDYEIGFANGDYEERYTFTLFQSVSGSVPKRYLSFTVSKDPAGDANLTWHVDKKDQADTVEAAQDGAWHVTVTGLPEYDADGQLYEYLLMEQDGTPLNMTFQIDENGDYTATVINSLGGSTIILVRKEWIDESDSQHREPVTVAVYDREDNEPVMYNGKPVTVTLGSRSEGVANGWYAFVAIGKKKADEVYVLETKVGEHTVPAPLGDDGKPTCPTFTGEGVTDPTAIEYTTSNHKYAVTYSYEANFGAEEAGEEPVGYRGCACYTITNRRLGNIDLTVTKTWYDGDGEARTKLAEALKKANLDLAVQLSIQSEPSLGQTYAITNKGYGDDAVGDTVTIAPGMEVPIYSDADYETPADSIQPLELDVKDGSTDTQELHFYGLPKYDGNGAAVRYTVDEVFVDANGAVVKDLSKYPAVQAAWQEYRKTVTENDYVVDSQHRDRDKQSFDVANRLGGTKQVSWYALWQDKYAYESGNRPDVFLNIYRTVHVKGDDGSIVEKTEAAILNYRWENVQEEGVELATFWQCIVDNLPKYDEYGYEIKYYAEMQALVTAEDFYYLPTRYAAGQDGAGESVFGNEDGGVTDGSKFPQDSVEADYILDSKTVDEGEVQPGHAWLLRAGNTFVNTIQGAVTYQGEKVWANLPYEYPDDDLPTVTFALDRQVGDDTTTKEERVATMTIPHDQWEALAASGVRQHTFTFTHTGENEPTKDGAEVEVPEDETLLPRFDKLGRLYTYTLQEAEVEFDGADTGKVPRVADVFTQNIAGATATNTYAPDTGVLTAKKYLTVPVDAAAYPAITLRLTRTYTRNNDETSAPETVPLQKSIVVWSAADVTNAVEEAKEQATGGETTVTVEHTFPFENLPLYAPNGSPYVYTIAEDKSQLNGYDTWAAKGDVLAENLEADTYKEEFVGNLTPRKTSDTPGTPDTTVDASFLNKQADPEPITLTGTKVWEDLSNAYGFRPEELTLTLERRAPAQPGQYNDIPWKEVPSFSVGGQTCANGSFTIQADPDAEGEAANTWSYTVTGLERYAPNGKAWEYRVTENVPDKYTAASKTVMQTGVNQATNTVTMDPLTNSILTEVKFQKAWVDSDGNPITQDVLGGGIELEVTFQVQVNTTNAGSLTGGGPWKTIAACFANDETMRGYEDEKTIRAPLGSDEWGKTRTFEKLPLYIKSDTSAEYQATYRVVETSVKIYQGDSKKPLEEITYQASKEERDTFTYTVDGCSPIQPYYGDKNGQSIKDTVHKNQLQTVSLTAQKVWQNDNPTVYATRPAFNGDRYDWQTTLVVERSTDGVHWEEIPAASRETVYGTNAENTSNTVTFSGLPTFGFNDEGEMVTYQYRVREVNTDEAQTLLPEKGTFHSGYTVTYTAAEGNNPHTVTNTLQTTTITAEKKWNDNKGNGDTRPASITLELQYLKAGVSLDAAAETDWCSFAPQAVVTLNGETDADTEDLLYYESDEWKAVWNKVPVTMPGSATDKDGKTLYRVKEAVTGAYIIENEQKVTSDGTAFTITNTPSVTPSVQKTWLGVTQAEVTVQLQRAVEGGEPQNVPGGEVKLNAGNNWKHTFAPQPKYDADGNLYTYTVVETKVGGQDAQDAAKEGDFGISYGRSPSDDYELYVYNYKLGALQIVKDWADVDDVENRPKDLELTVERTTDQNPSDATQWKKVEGLTWTWTKNGQNDAQWTITFDDLPLYDVATGDPYTYRVREETVPEGYVCEEIECETPLVFHFKNTRHEPIDIPVQKYWVDNNDHFGWRKPVTVELYANDAPMKPARTLELKPSIAETIANFFTGGDAGWGGEFTDLPKYDADGRIIQYTIAETTDLAHYGDPDYNPVDDTLTVTNTANGELTVRKTVLGNGTDPGAAFHFTVTLDEALDGAYGDMTFTGGVAEFTLQNGQSKTAGDLPAGTAYTVTEAEAGKGAYITTSTGASGRIEPGATVEAAFTNVLRRISVPVTKRWEDDNDRLGIRPASITVKLRADGADTGKTLTLNSENGWSGSFAGLPEYENGQKIAYTVEEVQVRGYATQITGDAGGYLIVNRLLPSEGGAPQDPAPTAAPAQIIPQTGDDLPVGLLAGLAIAAAGALAVLLALRKRRGRK